MTALAVLLVSVPAIAQTNQNAVLPVEHTTAESARKAAPSAGDYFEGYTRTITYDRMIPPYGLQVTFEKTVHIIFPSPIIYVDLGSNNLIAGKASGAENVLRVKAAMRGFESETNLAVITGDGSFYTYSAHVM